MDVSPAMVERARLMGEARNVRWITGDVLDPSLVLPSGHYDVVTAVASLHHLPPRPGMARLAELDRRLFWRYTLVWRRPT